MSANKQTVNYNDFSANDLEFTPPEENARSKSQLVGYVRYKNGHS